MNLCAYRCGRESLPDADYCDRCGKEAVGRIIALEDRRKADRRARISSGDDLDNRGNRDSGRRGSGRGPGLEVGDALLESADLAV